MDTAYQDPTLPYQQSYFDDNFFFQTHDDNDDLPDMTYFDPWTAQGSTQNFQFTNYSTTMLPFINTSLLDSVESMAPISVITPSQAQLVSSPQMLTAMVDNEIFIEHAQSQSRCITPSKSKPEATPGLVPRSTPSSANLRVNTEGIPGQAPSTPPSRKSKGARTCAHVASAEQGSLSETRSEKKRDRSDSSEDEDSESRKTKRNHTIIERRYRDNLNEKINQLHCILQATEANSPLMRFDARPSDPGRRVRKCEIMTKTLQYIRRSELESRQMRDEIQRLQEQVQSLEKMVKCEDCTLLQNIRGLGFNIKPC